MTEFPLLLSLVVNSFEDPFAVFGLICAGALALGLLRKSYGLSFFFAVGVTFVLTKIIKSIFKIPRPDDALVLAAGYRFPSMHSAIAGALVTSLAWHFYFHTANTITRILIVVGALSLITFVAWTRVHLGVHEVIDVVGGAVLGISISLTFHFLLRRYKFE